METNKWGQTVYHEEADEAYPEGCTCPDDSGSCEWCEVYYHGIDLGVWSFLTP